MGDSGLSMSDDLSQTGSQDDLRINVHQEHEVRYWSENFHVTPERLKRAIEVAGPMVKDVQDELAKT